MKQELTAAFKKYVSAYDLQDVKIQLKYIHTGRVAANCERIARSLDLSSEDIFLSWEIGMLHDIGRFEQLRRYNTFIDAQSIDHASFGADLLFQDGLILQFESDSSKYGIIETAIRCHSLYRLPEDLNEREIMFCQIIRDADKVDIFRANYETGMAAIYNVTEEELAKSDVTLEVYEAFCEEHAVLRSLKKTPIDHLIGHISLMFELVYPESRNLAAEQGYLEKLVGFPSENPDTQKVLQAAGQKYDEFARDAAVYKLGRALQKASSSDVATKDCQNSVDFADSEGLIELENLLWLTLTRFQNYPFYTAKNLEFSYTIKGNEMFVSRKDKSITRATVNLTFRNALRLGRKAPGPKALGTFGASYLYPVFRKIGVLL
ncbi:MAG: HD domain-containing protein [Lachnospiraceae bacterium]|nr:HD domain-containing protein [Lachnospiraceae bacterium]